MSQFDALVLRVDTYLFGVDTRLVQDVFHPVGITPVPKSTPEVVGLLNLRGRVVTAVCARRKLDLPPLATGNAKAVGAEIGGDLYGLIVDGVDDVLSIDSDDLVSPSTLPPRWAHIVSGVYRLPAGILLMTEPRRFVLREARVAA